MSPADAFGAATRRLAPAASPRGDRPPGLRLVPRGRSRARRAPFVVLILLVLGIGLVGLLLLNTSLQQGSFELRDLRRENQLLRDRRVELVEQLAERSAPDELAERAASLGMVPAETTNFLKLNGGSAAGGER